MKNVKPQLIGHLEYIQDPPEMLKKAMEYKWAKDLIENGTIRLTNVEVYRKANPTNPDQADPYEDVGITICKGTECETRTINSTYIFCCADSESDDDDLLSIDSSYNSIIRIINPLKFFEKIHTCIHEQKGNFLCGAGSVYYDKGELQNRTPFWGDNTFQKHEKYAYQMEFRFKALDGDYKSHGDFIDLTLGNIEDLVELQRLP